MVETEKITEKIMQNHKEGSRTLPKVGASGKEKNIFKKSKIPKILSTGL